MNSQDGADLDEMSEAWERFVRSLRRARARTAASSEGDGLSLSQYVLLSPLFEEEPLPTGELAARAAIAPPTATRIIDGLERHGIVAREPSPDDRRVVHVRFTAAGRKVAEEKRAQHMARRREVARALTPEEREQAARILRRMADLVDEL